MSNRSEKRRRSHGPSLVRRGGMGPGDRVTLTLGGLDDRGEASALLDGAPVNVAGGLPGEQVVIEVVRAFPERIAARVATVLSSSADRVAPPCPYYLHCTGCQLQHASYERQLEFKRERVRTELSRWPRLARAEVLPALPSPRQFGYRNHARFTVNKSSIRPAAGEAGGGLDPGAGSVGYVNATTRRFLRVERCLLMDERINEVLALVQGRCRGMSQLSIRAGNAEPMVQPRLADPGIAVTSGQDHFETEVLGRRFRVAGASFFQVNAGQLGNMIGMLRDRLGLTGAETVVDAYCGVGTFAILLAPYARRVIGIEDSAPAVEDARANSSGLTNIEFIMGRAEEVLARVEGAVDAVILDPPRAGCHPGAIDAVIRLKPARVVLVSCEPSALARDLARLTEGPFILESVQPVDMFPQTRHVEAVAFLKAAS